MKQLIDNKIRLVATIIICLLFVLISFSSTVVKSENSQENQIQGEANPVTCLNPKSLSLFNFRILNLDWNYWDNKPDVFLMPVGNIGIGTSNPEAKLDVYGNIAINGKEIINASGSIKTNEIVINGNVTTTGEYKFTSPNIYYLNIPTANFQSCIRYFPADAYINTGYQIYLIEPYTIIELICPVYLPQRATVTELEYYLYDNHASYNIEAWMTLNRRHNSLPSIEGLSQLVATTSGSNNYVQANSTSTIDHPTVDNKNYQYYIYFMFNPHHYSSDLSFYGCRIAYMMDTIAP